MDKFNRTSRLSRLSEKVILYQSDTTVGFSSQDAKKLQKIKSRDPSKAFIKIFKDLKTLNMLGLRVPYKYKNTLRRSKKSSFVVKNIAFRVVNNPINSQTLRDIPWHYSTSANESGKNFNLDFCEEKADIIIQNKDGLRELNSSSLYKLNHTKRKKIR
ncbi:hypothetical protein [Sulfurimonas sp.]|uniref:hypothetical protein n=1 Tax=Sulfurimonas sp. TaxID=2022749 RepID=UPI002B482E55|nr:hypothetical protein [Sulfurimonas sp.]